MNKARLRCPKCKFSTAIAKKQKIAIKEEPELTPVPKMESMPPEAQTVSSIPEKIITKIVEEPVNTLTPEEQPRETTKKAKKFKISPEVIETPEFSSVPAEEPSRPPDFTPIPTKESPKPSTEVHKLESFLNDTKTTDTAPVPAGGIFAANKKTKKLKVTSEVIETPEVSSTPSEKPFPAAVKSDKLKIDSEVSQTTESMPIPAEEDESLPFTFKKPSIKLADIDDESLQTSRSDLFNTFSSAGGQLFDKSEIPPEPIEIPPGKDKKKKGEKKKGEKKKEKPVKPSKKDEKKPSKKEGKKEVKKESKKEVKKESKKDTKKKAPSPSIFVDLKQELETKEPDITTIDLGNLPKDKDSLYQDLIALEGKRYSLERSLKQLQSELEEKSVDKREFDNRSNDLRSKMKKISLSINTIRKNISKLK